MYGRFLREMQFSRVWPALQYRHDTSPTEGGVPRVVAKPVGAFWLLPTCAAELSSPALFVRDPFCKRPSRLSILGFVSSTILPNTGLVATLASWSTNSAKSRNRIALVSDFMISSTKRRHLTLKLKGSFRFPYSLRSWRYCRRARSKVLAAEPLSGGKRAAKPRGEWGGGLWNTACTKTMGFLNSPHTSVWKKRIGREKYTRQSNVRWSLIYFPRDTLLCFALCLEWSTSFRRRKTSANQ